MSFFSSGELRSKNKVFTGWAGFLLGLQMAALLVILFLCLLMVFPRACAFLVCLYVQSPPFIDTGQIGLRLILTALF
jgi:hypothetical protein